MVINIVFISDVHYGLYKKQFRGKTHVASKDVNAAMLQQINALPMQTLPGDGGVMQDKKIGHIEDLIITGDIVNREEDTIQSAAASWQQFEDNYMDQLNVLDYQGKKAQVLLTPGNHDVSDAVGYYKKMNPPTDKTAMVEIYNRMMKPETSISTDAFDYYKNVVNYSKDMGGIHFMFPQIWPDSANRVWMEKDLKKASSSTPVILFTHVPPYGDAKLFFNPNTPGTINSKDKFENLLREHYKDALTIGKKSKDSIEENNFDKFLERHPNIKAYFHGHQNKNEFYTYRGLDNKLSLPVFRVDSPMKGEVSSKDQTKLSFQLISIDTDTQTMTVRECLWNTNPASSHPQIVWGVSKTIPLRCNL